MRNKLQSLLRKKRKIQKMKVHNKWKRKSKLNWKSNFENKNEKTSCFNVTNVNLGYMEIAKIYKSQRQKK